MIKRKFQKEEKKNKMMKNVDVKKNSKNNLHRGKDG